MKTARERDEIDRLVDEVAALPPHRGWTFTYEYPGYFCLSHPELPHGVFFTPDWEHAETLDVQVQTPDGRDYPDLGAVLALPRAGRTGQRLLDLVRPTLDKLLGTLAPGLPAVDRDRDRASGGHVQLIRDFLTPHDVEFVLRWADSRSGWTRGRQGTGYEVLHVKDAPDFSGLVQRAILRLGPYFEDFYDAYLIRYQEGDFIPPHRDEAAFFGKRHHRVNAMVAIAEAGGDLLIDGVRVEFPLGAAVDFFPDEEEHEVTPVTRGRRILFSVGCWQ